MKPYLYISLCLVVLASLMNPAVLLGQSDPGAYMTSISSTYGPIKKDTWDYMSAVANNRSARKIDKRRKELIASIDVAAGQVRKMKDWEGDASLRDSTLGYLRFSKIILNEDYARIVDMEEVAEQSYDLMEAYMLARKKASEKYQVIAERLDAAGKAFAARHNVNLITEEDDKLSQKIKAADEVFGYYDKLFLIMFKSQVEENYVIAALSQGDVSAAEQSRNKLLENSKEGLKALGETGAFKGDNSVKVAAQNLLNFYKQEAESKLPSLIDFYLKKENFEKLKAVVDAKPQNKLTKEEVDSFNAAVKEYNEGIGVYNKVNEELNGTRGKLIDAWNKAGAGFTERHVANR